MATRKTRYEIAIELDDEITRLLELQDQSVLVQDNLNTKQKPQEKDSN